jgi:hypothetical protein
MTESGTWQDRRPTTKQLVLVDGEKRGREGREGNGRGGRKGRRGEGKGRE